MDMLVDDRDDLEHDPFENGLARRRRLASGFLRRLFHQELASVGHDSLDGSYRIRRSRPSTIRSSSATCEVSSIGTIMGSCSMRWVSFRTEEKGRSYPIEFSVRKPFTAWRTPGRISWPMGSSW